MQIVSQEPGGDPVSPLPAETSTAPSQAVFAVAKFENMDPVAMAFGSPAVALMRQGLEDRATAFVGAGGVVCWAEDRLLMFVSDPVDLPGWTQAEAGRLAAVEGALLRALALAPFDIGDGEAFAAITTAVDVVDMPDGVAADKLATVLNESLFKRLSMASPRLGRLSPDKASRERYRFNMAKAALVARCMRESSVTLAWQAIRTADPTGPALYREGLLRLRDGNSELFAPARFVAMLEDLGLVRALDAHVIGLAIERLRADRLLVLGCNISAQSAIIDGWWAPILATLQLEPDIASRLIIEITESAQFVSTSLAVEFVDKIRGLGCRIATDDFGVGHTSLSSLQALKPDIIKIDAIYLKLATGGRGRPETAMFNHLVGLARSLAETVIVEGVEDAEMLAIAQRAGAEWFQGHFLGAPARVLLPGASAAASTEKHDKAPPPATVLHFRRGGASPAARLVVFASFAASAAFAALHLWGAA